MNMARANISPAAATLLKALVETLPEAFTSRSTPLPKTAADAAALIRSGKITPEQILAAAGRRGRRWSR